MIELEENTDSDFEDELFALMVKHGRINADSLRDYRIKKIYSKLRDSGLSGKEARERLADDFATGVENIKRILYRK